MPLWDTSDADGQLVRIEEAVSNTKFDDLAVATGLQRAAVVSNPQGILTTDIRTDKELSFAHSSDFIKPH